MADALYLPGEVARISLSVADMGGVAADPGALSLKVKPPMGEVVTYAYGTDAVIVRDSLGNFHADISLASAGQWAYRWELGAPNAGAAEGVITVRKSWVI